MHCANTQPMHVQEKKKRNLHVKRSAKYKQVHSTVYMMVQALEFVTFLFLIA